MLSQDHNSVVLLGDIGVFGFRDVSLEHPTRVINAGILEQSMIGLGAGLSSVGCIPTIHTIAPFLVERAYEQLKIDFAYQNLSGNFVSVGASFDYSGLGCTHHCPSDIGILSNIPGMNIFVPGHAMEFDNQFSSNWNSGGLNYFRLSEHTNKSAIVLSSDESSRKVKEGTLGIVVVVGPMLDLIVDALSGIDLEVHYVNRFSAGSSIKLNSTLRNAPIFLVEPYYSGRLLNEILELAFHWDLKPVQVGVPVAFLRGYGSFTDQIKAAQLDRASLRRRILFGLTNG
jgi:transketolase